MGQMHYYRLNLRSFEAGGTCLAKTSSDETDDVSDTSIIRQFKVFYNLP